MTKLKFSIISFACLVLCILITTSCKDDIDDNIIITTNEVINIKFNSAICGGAITSEGSEILSRGVCWSTNSVPTILDNKTTDSIGAGNYSSTITGLQPETTYFVRAYAISKNGSNYGNTYSFTTTKSFTIFTTNATNISHNSIICGGNITSDGGTIITSRGVVWDINPNPTISLNTKTNDGTGTGSFTSNVTNLAVNTTYYLRAYAINSLETAYGNEIVVKTTGIVDFDGNIYSTVTIGTQTWMAENLKVTHYNDGTPIPNVVDESWSAIETGAYCWYNNDYNKSGKTYGALYNWHAINTNKLAPKGWHVPSENEWQILEMHLGLSKDDAVKNDVFNANWRGPGIGSQLAGNYNLWEGTILKNDLNFGKSGFMALPGGYRSYNEGGVFIFSGAYTLAGCWWSSTENSNGVWSRFLHGNDTRIAKLTADKHAGISIRCIKD